MAAKPITLNELLTEMKRASAGNSEGQTMREICAATGLSLERAKAMIRIGMASGQIAVTRSRRMGIDGVERAVPVWIPVAAAATSPNRVAGKRK